MSTLVRTETGRDARGNKFLTNTYESFTQPTPAATASNWTLSQADGVWTLTETYTETVPDPGGGGGTTFPDIWSLDISTVTDPIETFILFRNNISAQTMGWWQNWKAGREPGPTTYPDDGFPAYGPSTTEWTNQLLLRFNRGEVDYLTPRIVVKHQKVYSVPPHFDGVGFATNTISGCPFNFSNQVNFLMTGATATQEGGNYRVTMEWLTSRPGGWDSYLYGP
jgi:hypothetical protein